MLLTREGNMRRIVTGHRDGSAVIVSDDEVSQVCVAEGTLITALWGADDVPTFPDAGAPAQLSGAMPQPGGYSVGVLTIAPDSNEAYHQFIASALAEFADPTTVGAHRTPTADFIYVASGGIVLELDHGVEIEAHAGDFIVQNGTRHRWHNRGSADAVLISFVVGAHTRKA
jgi:quercetin dioxygenase-like cupin family protein